MRVGREKVSHKSGSAVCTTVRACGDVWVDSVMCVYTRALCLVVYSLLYFLCVLACFKCRTVQSNAAAASQVCLCSVYVFIMCVCVSFIGLVFCVWERGGRVCVFNCLEGVCTGLHSIGLHGTKLRDCK